MTRLLVLAVGYCLVSLGPVQAQPSQFDGTYFQPGGTSGTGCGTTILRSALHVKDGKASMQTVTAGLLEGDVKPDGSISIPAGANHLSGKIAGSHFSGELVIGLRNSTCRFGLELDRH